ncbi:MAG: acetyl-CoA carboxylase biotin carboxyl carrier protein subunit [Deltaproteobacteria bacterium]|nr:acetyl-CoA carboxylase biotin carboxyl carrier protein subunit [Deltaproteobacteria bacterium]
MNYIATIGDREVKVTVEEVGVARYQVTGDGKKYLVDAHQVQDSVWSILYGANSFEVDVQRRGEDYEVLIGGDCHKFTLMNEQLKALSRAGGKAAAGKALVTSPMPGKVVKLLVAEGEEVQADQGVIVVEAMKMENELKSAITGKIKEIFVQEGEVVESGTKLLLVE